MKQCLAVPADENIPAFIVAQYDASEFDERLKGILLFPPGA